MKYGCNLRIPTTTPTKKMVSEGFTAGRPDEVEKEVAQIVALTYFCQT
jgi:hypothetical protein